MEIKTLLNQADPRATEIIETYQKILTIYRRIFPQEQYNPTETYSTTSNIRIAPQTTWTGWIG